MKIKKLKFLYREIRQIGFVLKKNKNNLDWI